jgi:predicted RND superfamily exporter protein
VGFVFVGLLLYLEYRRLADTLLSLLPLSVGMLWMLGGMVLLGLEMNFFNIFVTTMIIGIGVDYGIHMVNRYREHETDAPPELEKSLRETGRAVVLAALSTIVGFGSMSLSHYPGVRSMGLVAVLGALATAFVAITLLPAFFGLRKTRR